MNAKEYLKRVEEADTMIDEMLKERDQLRGMTTRITQQLKPVIVTGGGMQGGFTNASDKIIDLERRIDSEIDRFVDLKAEALELLAKVCEKNTKHYQVLHRHYILYESFEQIAVDMGYVYRNVCYLHGRALQTFQKVLDEHVS